MRDVPIIFSAPMVQALLAGRKTMTRRLAWRPCDRCGDKSGTCNGQHKPSPWKRVKPGDLLWVRENWRPKISHSCFQDACDCEDIVVRYCADPTDSEPSYFAGRDVPSDWILPKQAARGDVPCIHMPLWASRLTLEVTAVKIERLQDISEEDALAEGIMEYPDGFHWEPNPEPYVRLVGMTARQAFLGLWDLLHGPESLDANPELVVLTFAVHQQNINSFLKRRAA